MFCSLWEETLWGAVLQRIKVPFMPFELYWKTFRQVTLCNHCLRACLVLLFSSSSLRELHVFGMKLRRGKIGPY